LRQVRHELAVHDAILACVAPRSPSANTAADIFLLFQLRRPDVWPVDDFGVRKGFARIHDLSAPPTPKAQALGEPYRPHRSTAAWYCWQAVDTVLPTA